MDKKRYILKTVGRTLQILDTHKFNRVVNTHEVQDQDDAYIELNHLNESFEIGIEMLALKTEISFQNN